MCAEFVAALKEEKMGNEWVAYAETGGWDILLVRRGDGAQIGVQAKLRFGLAVVNQAIEDHWGYLNREGPDYRAVLIPAGQNPGFDKICAYVGITVLTVKPSPPKGVYYCRIEPPLPAIDGRYEHPTGSEWFELCPQRRHELPEYIPDVAAGASAPIQLTSWKIKAIKIAIILDLRGFVTRADFGTIKIDYRRWLAQGWLRAGPDGWIRGAIPDFRAQHPIVYEQIAADASKWLPPSLLLKQAAK